MDSAECIEKESGARNPISQQEVTSTKEKTNVRVISPETWLRIILLAVTIARICAALGDDSKSATVRTPKSPASVCCSRGGLLHHRELWHAC